MRKRFGLAAAMLAAAGVAGAIAQDKLSGTVTIDGSSTVLPIMSAAAELFKAEQPAVRVPVGRSGTGGGFKKFLDPSANLRTDITNASRPISPEETSAARERGVQFIELPIALDGLAIVANPRNTFCADLTIEELRRIWEPDSRIANWKDVRAGFPDLKLKLYGPGTDSGTFDYFAEAVVGGKKTRADFTASEDDNTLVQGVSGDAGGLGYFGYAYFDANRARLKLLAIGTGSAKPLLPSPESVRNLQYPLARPLFIYVNRTAADRPETTALIEFFFKNAPKIVEHKRVGYIALTPELYAASSDRYRKRITGTRYTDPASHARPLAELFLNPPNP